MGSVDGVLEIERKHSMVRRDQFCASRVHYQTLRLSGKCLRFDRESNELVITDAEQKQMKPIMNYMIEMVDAVGLKTFFPFKILADPERPAEH